jgi:transcriptional regulator with XRE-family HTH domain
MLPVMSEAVGAELRLARERANLSLRDAAEKAGVSRGYLSKAENGKVVPSWEMLVRIAAVYGREPRLRLLSLQDDLLARTKQMAAKTPLQRLAGHKPNPQSAIFRLVDAGVACVIAGAAAAVLQGLPMTIDRLVVLVRDNDDNLAALVDMLMTAHVLFRELDPDDMRVECERQWLVDWCETEFILVPDLPEAVQLSFGSAVISALPLTLLAGSDSDVADVFQAVRTVLAG